MLRNFSKIARLAVMMSKTVRLWAAAALLSAGDTGFAVMKTAAAVCIPLPAATGFGRNFPTLAGCAAKIFMTAAESPAMIAARKRKPLLRKQRHNIPF